MIYLFFIKILNVLTLPTKINYISVFIRLFKLKINFAEGLGDTIAKKNRTYRIAMTTIVSQWLIFKLHDSDATSVNSHFTVEPWNKFEFTNLDQAPI